MTGRGRTCVALVLVVWAALFSGCVGRAGQGETAGGALPPQRAVRVVTDDLGRTITIPAELARVVSLAPNLTENIFAVGGGDRLVGVTTFCDFPAQARSIAKVGDTMSPNMETIVGLKPDVVFVSTASQIETFAETLNRNGIQVYVTNPDSLDAVLRNLLQLGEIFGTLPQAEKVVGDLRERIELVKARGEGKEPQRVFVQISREPLFTIGKGSFLTSMLETAGARSVTADVETAYPKLSKETAAALAPDAIILSDSEDNREPNEVFRRSPAVLNGRVIRVNADIISRPGPRLVDALEQIGEMLHTDK
ncbi:cobalamin-binding protein [soil metagenome]